METDLCWSVGKLRFLPATFWQMRAADKSRSWQPIKASHLAVDSVRNKFSVFPTHGKEALMVKKKEGLSPVTMTTHTHTLAGKRVACHDRRHGDWDGFLSDSNRPGHFCVSLHSVLFYILPLAHRRVPSSSAAGKIVVCVMVAVRRGCGPVCHWTARRYE